MREKIVKILNSDDSIITQTKNVKGWIRTVRQQKTFAFLEINDGSCISSLQIIVDENSKDFSKVQQITTGSSVSISGTIVQSPGKNQKYEMKASEIHIYGHCDSSYPLQKKRHSFEFLRSIAHLRSRTNTQGAITRVRNTLIFHSHKFFQEKGFYYIQTPVITSSDTEGAGDLFRVTTLDDLKKDPKEDFFDKPTFLTVSGQLNSETYACGLSDVYVFSPTFRAENSHTTRHLAEFWMLEPEMAFYDLTDTMDLAEEYLKYVLKAALENNIEDLNFFNKFIDKTLIERLHHVIDNSFERVTYTDAISILEKSKQKFEYEVKWGNDLQTEHERFLSEEYFKKPVIVTDYPKNIKAFYMKNNDDDKTVRAMDILVPKIGEIIGGSQREDNYDILKKKIEDMDLDIKEYWWYLELRKYGTVPHSGFGLGFERLIQFTTGMENIRDVIPFPRSPGHCEF